MEIPHLQKFGGFGLKVLVACEYSGIVRDAFQKLGHDAMSCDLLPTESNQGKYSNIWSFKENKMLPNHWLGDVFEAVECDNWDIMIAHPPCTHLSVSGARWFPPHTSPDEAGYKPLWKRFEALAFVDKLLNTDIPKICLENPLSVISSHIRKSDQTIQPWQFGHPESKKTCLWLKNLPKLEETNNVYDEMMKLPNKERNRVWWMGSNKGHERSRFYTGIAEAMALQWGGDLIAK